MQRWHRGDGLALAAVALGAVGAWTATGAALTWAPHPGGPAAAELAVPAVAVAQAVEPTTQAASAPRPRAVDAVGRPAAPLEGVAFRATSFLSGDVVQGDYVGRLTHDGQGFRLHISSGQIRSRVTEGFPAARVGSVRLSLVAHTPEGVRVVRAGKRHRIQETLESGENLWLEDVTLELDGVAEDTAAGDVRLVVELQVVAQDGGARPVTRALAYAEWDVLFTLFGWEEFDGC